MSTMQLNTSNDRGIKKTRAASRNVIIIIIKYLKYTCWTKKKIAICIKKTLLLIPKIQQKFPVENCTFPSVKIVSL